MIRYPEPALRELTERAAYAALAGGGLTIGDATALAIGAGRPEVFELVADRDGLLWWLRELGTRDDPDLSELFGSVHAIRCLAGTEILPVPARIPVRPSRALAREGLLLRVVK